MVFTCCWTFAEITSSCVTIVSATIGNRSNGQQTAAPSGRAIRRLSRASHAEQCKSTAVSRDLASRRFHSPNTVVAPQDGHFTDENGDWQAATAASFQRADDIDRISSPFVMIPSILYDASRRKWATTITQSTALGSGEASERSTSHVLGANPSLDNVNLHFGVVPANSLSNSLM